MTTQTIHQILEDSLLSLASYAGLAQAADSSLTPEQQIQQFRTALIAEGVTEGVADYLSQNYRVVDHKPNTSGYSGTLFRRLDTPGDYSSGSGFIFAQRGTDEALADGVIANSLGIALTGYAHGQVDAMGDYWQFLKSTIPGLAGQEVRVTGHSLGGHLATAFAVDIDPLAVQHATTFNGAGLASSFGAGAGTFFYEAVAGLFGVNPGVIPSSLVSNFQGEAGPNFVSGSNILIGSLDEIFTEFSPSLRLHKMENLTASLMIHEVFSLLDGELSLPQIGSILHGATNDSELHQARLETVTAINRLEQQVGRLEYQGRLLELRAPQDGVVKDLATTTVGAVVEPGTVLLSLVPLEEPLLAEVLIENQDIGFVAPEQAVRVKIAAYQFQKYGMLDGVVKTVSADSSQERESGGRQDNGGVNLAFKALIELDRQRLDANGLNLPLAAGMQVTAEIKQGRRTVLEYLLSPVRRIASEAGMER